MTVTIHNISEVLDIIKTLRTEDGNSKLPNVKKLFYQRGIQIGTERINFEENCQFCEFGSLLVIEKEKIITKLKAKIQENEKDKIELER